MGHPVLSHPASPVKDSDSEYVSRLIVDMIETMNDVSGAGLAAPQVHVPLRVVIFHVPVEEGTDDLSSSIPLTVLINPKIEILDSGFEYGMEACLSVPGLIGEVPRARVIRYSGINLDGEIIKREAEGFHARVVQHECDHLDGVLYPMRMKDLSTLSFTSELGRGRHDSEG